MTEDAFKLDFPKYLSFLLQFCPEVDQDKAVRAKMATVGIAAGQPWDASKLSETQKAERTRFGRPGLQPGFGPAANRPNSFKNSPFSAAC